MNKEKLIEVYSDIVRRRRCSLDEIIVRMTLRNEFLADSQDLLGQGSDEEDLLWELLRLRKKGDLPSKDDVLA